MLDEKYFIFAFSALGFAWYRIVKNKDVVLIIGVFYQILFVLILMGKNYNQFTVIRNYISNNELETIKNIKLIEGLVIVVGVEILHSLKM
jgi:hypothetical protein